MKIRKHEYIRLIYSEKESEAVRLALTNLRRDLIRVLDCRVNGDTCPQAVTIRVGTIGISGGDAAAEADLAGGRLEKKEADSMETLADTGLLKDEWGMYRKEAFLIQEKNGEILIAGTDRRGTIYGIYDFCQTLGVSPWHFFADVPVKVRKEVEMEDGLCKVDYPSVEYRGIFINDEEELEHWVQRYMGEETIGVKTYEKIFELMLRLKMNYIWPAMHVNSFNLKQENGALADRMGIVVGTSHCDMLMRSNNREWKPWIAKKGYADAAYDYSIPGRNREILEEYWRESIEQNREFEVCYTMGMRGIHDSGFETKTLEGLTGEALLKAKMELLDSVIRAQERLLEETLGRKTLKTFIPYKEVLELYDNGLEIPEDLTMIWVNDNYGYIRRYPGEREKKRSGGHGIYYHNSYWANPTSSASYLFITTIPMTHTRNELKKAWAEGIRKIWVTNFGALKPLEQQMSFYAQLAWDVGKENPLSDREEEFLVQWIDGMFSGCHGKELAPLLLEFDQLTNVRKLEHMDCDAFSQTAYGDEAAARIHHYESMFHQVNAVYEKLPKQEKDAFFQLILMKIHAAYFTNCMYYYADRSNLCVAQGKMRAAKEYTKCSLAFDHARRKMIDYYNHVMSNGKWNGILTPEDFPPPRTAMYPACMPPLAIGETKPVVTVWNEGDSLEFVKESTKWIEIANAGVGSLTYDVTGPKWLSIESGSGIVSSECRILVRPDWELVRKLDSAGVSGELVVCCDGAEVRRIPVTCTVMPKLSQTGYSDHYYMERMLPMEEDGMISVEADAFERCGNGADCGKNGGKNGGQRNGDCRTDGQICEAGGTGWKSIAHLGRGTGCLVEAEEEGAVISYPVRFTSAGTFRLEIHRFPTLHSVGRIRVGVSVDAVEDEDSERCGNLSGKEDSVYRKTCAEDEDWVCDGNAACTGDRVQMLETQSNDAGRADWLENIRNNVDKLYGELVIDQPGVYRITFHAVDRYFAFSRFVVYTKERKENSLGMTGGDQRLPEDFEVGMFADSFYGLAEPPLRPALYLPAKSEGDMLMSADLYVNQERLGEPVEPSVILAAAQKPFAETDGTIRVDAAAALAQTVNAYAEGDCWKYCNSPSHGETGLAMYVRDGSLSWKNPEEAPTLNYRIRTGKGTYRIWILAQMWGMTTSHFTVGIDGRVVPENELYGGEPIWRYSNEQVWKWIPAWEEEMEDGEHVLTIYSMSSHLRFDRIYLTTGEELPPVDCEW